MTAPRKRPLQRKRVTVQHKPVPPNIADPPFVAGLETREEASNWVRSHFRNALDEQLKEIEDKRKLVQQLESELRPAILAARTFGATWAQIGAALGVTPQSAHRKYGHKTDSYEDQVAPLVEAMTRTPTVAAFEHLASVIGTFREKLNAEVVEGNQEGIIFATESEKAE